MNWFAQAATGLAAWFGVSPEAVAGALIIIVIGIAAICFLPLLKRLRHNAAGTEQIAKMVTLIVCYSLCSSMLLIINKVSVTYIPAASTILLCQVASCAVFIKVMGATGVLSVDSINYDSAKKFTVLVLAFVGILFANVKALQYNPVDTLICLRASTPMVIAVIEYLFMGREMPSLRSWGALLGVLVGVCVYVGTDANFGSSAYMWLGIWYALAIFDMVFSKHICDTVEMSTWTRTYYLNALSVPPIILLAVVNGDIATLTTRPDSLPTLGLLAIALSCVAGMGMSYFSFALRAVISATSFSVIGNICKILTILVNLVIWDKHSDAIGTASLFLCLLMGSFYKQAPMRCDAGQEDAVPNSALSLMPKQGNCKAGQEDEEAAMPLKAPAAGVGQA